MANEPHKLIALPNRTYQAIARSEVKKSVNTVGFKAKRIAEIDIIVAELTSNLVKHTTAGGHLLIKVLEGENPGIEIISIDSGPGMDIGRMMEDGMSSTQTLGQGLGAIKRLADEFDAYSIKGWGTIVLCRIFINKILARKKRAIEIGVIMLPKNGETECGDNYQFAIKGNTIKFAVCDGLGHGPQASLAAKQCLLSFKEHILLSPVDQLKTIHTEAKKTRGAVMHITNIDFNNKQLLYCGVGNISVKAHSFGKTRSCVSYNGIVGHSIPGTLNNHTMQWAKNDMLVMHSDGLTTKWDLHKYPSITKHDRTIIAAVLYKDHCRNTDDVIVTVISQYNRTT